MKNTNYYSFYIDDIKINVSYKISQQLSLPIVEEGVHSDNLSYVNEDIESYISINKEIIRPKKANDNDKVIITKIDKEKLIPEFNKFKDLKNYLFDKLKTVGDIKVKQAGTILMFSKDNIRRGLKYTKRENQTQFFADLNTCVSNAAYIGFINSDERHEQILGQDIYLTAIEFNNTLYGIKIKADVKKEQLNNKYNYAGHKVKEINILEIEKPEVTPGKTLITPGTISIAQLLEIFK